MEELMKCLKKLYVQLDVALERLNGRDHRDLSWSYFNILRTEVAGGILELGVHMKFSERKEEFDKALGGGSQVVDYLKTICERINDAVVGGFIFQTELLFRRYWITINNGAPNAKIHPILAFLFEDIQENWQKEQSKLMVAIWKARNTVHSGGIYYGANCTREYCGMQFEYKDGYAPDFSAIGGWYGLLEPAVEIVLGLALSDRVAGFGFIEHPSFKALGK